MKIAIIGAGFSGLATAWTFLQNNPELEVVVFDRQGIGAGASGVAAGLMHPFAGAHSKLNKWGREGYDATLSLLTAAKNALGKSSHHISGILRPALLPFQMNDFQMAAKQYPEDIQWLSCKEMADLIPGIANAPGIYIKNGAAIYPGEYLKGLWLACQKLGAVFQLHQISSLDELSDFDAIVVTMGAACTELKELSHLPLAYTKGQILELEWPEELPALPFALNSQIYCVMSLDKKRCLAGSTYERNFTTSATDITRAKEEILPKLIQLYPPLREAKIVNCHSGIRVSAPQHLPLLQQISNRCFALTGMGSKGLLYHALFAQRLYELFALKL